MNSDHISRSALKAEIIPILVRWSEDTTYIDISTEEAIDTIERVIDNAPAVEPEKICIATVTFDKEQLQEIVDEAMAEVLPNVQIEPIRCKDCKHQKKYWHEDKRMKDKGYWVYGCDLIDDSFVGTPVWGLPDQYCSSAERRVSDEPQ